MHLILTGATGLVGSSVLHYMLTNDAITAVSILSRRPVPMAEGHQKAKVILHSDFHSYPNDLLEQLKGASGCVWALGVSQSAVSRELYPEITVDYPVAAAKAFSSLSDPFKFVYVSGEGANTDPGYFTPYFGRIKGRAEVELLKLSNDTAFPSLKAYSLRPAGVDAKHQPEIYPYIPTLKASKAAYLVPLLAASRVVWPGMVSPTRELGRVLTELAMSDGEPLNGTGVSGEGRTVSNAGFKRLARI